MPFRFCVIHTICIIAPRHAEGESRTVVEKNTMECRTKDELEQHLSDVRRLAALPNLGPAEKDAAVRAERFAITLVKQHDASGHDGKRCPFATLL